MESLPASGYVKDSAGKPLADAIVMVIDSPEQINDIAAVTDSSGKFSLGQIKSPGKYILQVNYGDKSIRYPIELPLSENPLIIQIR